ncbi:hypothetical protein HNY73_005562 [Argiope bruennichi]|uniref:Uncharacterized protein n=1 Tax=Argiope bruennichi TaxID=94029 RepID=A0A8T0FGZ0_ARGBR|nr:hypothetical protein HNY73_005562 [Argiope bruennichi]
MYRKKCMPALLFVCWECPVCIMLFISYLNGFRSYNLIAENLECVIVIRQREENSFSNEITRVYTFQKILTKNFEAISTNIYKY